MVSSDKVTVYIDPDVAELIPMFLANRRQDIVYLKAAYAAQDIERIKAIGHNMKGTGGGYGFYYISKIGAQIEEMVTENKTESICALIDQLEDYLERVDVKTR